MQNTSRFEPKAGLAADTLLMTAADGLVQIGDLADGLSEGQGRRLSLKIRGDDAMETVAGVVACGTRSAYRTILENGMTVVTTYNTCLIVARNRHSHHHLRTTEQLGYDDTAVVPRGPFRMGRYEGRTWDSRMLDRGALPKEALSGSKKYLHKVVRESLLEPAGGMSDGIRTTLHTTDENSIILEWKAPNKWLGRQIQVMLMPLANTMSEFDEQSGILSVRDGDLARLDEETGIIGEIYDEGECDIDREIVEWLLGLDDRNTRAREVVRISSIEGVNRRPMYALVLEDGPAAHMANGLLVGSLRDDKKLGIEWVA